MKYIVLFRGINVGGNNKIEMNKLKSFFESLGYSNVQTYINSGNVIFDSGKSQKIINKEIVINFKKEYGQDIPLLIKTQKEIKLITKAIPAKWQNDDKQKTDVAYLFAEIDSKDILNDLPINKEYIDIRYTKGAIFWNIERKNYNKSRINKIISLKAYQFMTVRNVNTARYLAKV